MKTTTLSSTGRPSTESSSVTEDREQHDSHDDRLNAAERADLVRTDQTRYGPVRQQVFSGRVVDRITRGPSDDNRQNCDNKRRNGTVT